MILVGGGRSAPAWSSRAGRSVVPDGEHHELGAGDLLFTSGQAMTLESSTGMGENGVTGTAYTDTNRPDLPKGPTGVGVRLFTHFVLERAKA